jgi:hypothetical protein
MREFRMRAQAKFSCPFRLTLPDGQISQLAVQSFREKYSARAVGQITFRTRAVSSHRGALRNVINAARDAVDAEALNDEQRRSRTAKSCGPDAPVLASSLWIRSRATVARKPVTGESRKETVKTIAQGRPDCLR